jgi:O-antigen/teichoic acid export membrane protein
MVRYSAPLGVAGLGMLFIHYGDRFFLQRYVSLADIGIYSLAYKLGMFVANFHGPFVNYWSVEMFSIAKRRDGNAIYVRMFTYFALAMGMGGALIAIFSRPLITLLAPPAYSSAARYVPWLVFAYVLRSIGDHLRTPLLTESRTVKNTKVIAISVLICLGGYSFLIPRCGVAGAVAATFAAFTVMTAYGIYESQRVRHYQFEFARIAKLAAAILGPTALFTLFPIAQFWVQIGVGIGATATIPLILWITGFLDLEERAALRGLIDRGYRVVLEVPAS